MARTPLGPRRLEDRLAPAGLVRPGVETPSTDSPAEPLDLSGPVRWGGASYAVRGAPDTAGNGYVPPGGLTARGRITDTDGSLAGFLLAWAAATRAAFGVGC